MADYSKQQQVMKAAALGDSQKANELHGQFTDEELSTYNVYVIAVFANAMGVRFETDQSMEAIQRFAAEMEYDYRDANPPVKRLTVELIIRGMMGEDHLFDEITPDDQLRLQLMAIRKVVDQSDKMRNQLDHYLAEAAKLAAQWESEAKLHR